MIYLEEMERMRDRKDVMGRKVQYGIAPRGAWSRGAVYLRKAEAWSSPREGHSGKMHHAVSS